MLAALVRKRCAVAVWYRQVIGRVKSNNASPHPYANNAAAVVVWANGISMIPTTGGNRQERKERKK